MKPFLYPFENPTIDQALKYLNAMDFPVEIDKDQLFLWWKEKTIELCFDWGRFWAKGLIEQWYATEEYQQIKEQRSELENRKDMRNGKSSIFVAKSLSELRKIEEAKLTELEYSDDAKKLVVPKYSNYMIWKAGELDDPIPRLDCKPYGSGDDSYKYKEVPHYCGICDQSSQHWKNIREVLNSESLILPKSEAEKIYNIFYPEQGNTASAKEDKKEAPKSLNYLARFAKSLIQIHYGEDVANSIQSQLANPNSEINIDFKNKKLKAPDGKALANHLNAVDVDTIDN
ncbi:MULTISPECIES: hypothetical protein [Morganellaceae]|uniref:hypothetical protein n=1 Tax=Morganellaceae TaxID=1903414 RepID=UPI002246E382|nr:MULTISPECIES: hypothetical protein [Morganellaceae]MCW9690444.1 hypothetical protein [Proteus terrae]